MSQRFINVTISCYCKIKHRNLEPDNYEETMDDFEHQRSKQ